MPIPPILAQITPTDPQPFIDAYGPALGLILIACLAMMTGGLLMLYSKLNSATKAQDAITKAFGEQAPELAKLRSRVEANEAALDVAQHDRDRVQEELDVTRRTAEAAQVALQKANERATALEKQVAELGTKITALETERLTRIDDLKRETERATKMEGKVTDLQLQVADLRAQVARLEGENSALHKVIEKLNVVSVKPPPDDPNPPPPVALKVETVDKQERAA